MISFPNITNFEPTDFTSQSVLEALVYDLFEVTHFPEQFGELEVLLHLAKDQPDCLIADMGVELTHGFLQTVGDLSQYCMNYVRIGMGTLETYKGRLLSQKPLEQAGYIYRCDGREMSPGLRLTGQGTFVSVSQVIKPVVVEFEAFQRLYWCVTNNETQHIAKAVVQDFTAITNSNLTLWLEDEEQVEQVELDSKGVVFIAQSGNQYRMEEYMLLQSKIHWEKDGTLLELGPFNISVKRPS